MHWWFGHVFINRDLPVPTQASPEKKKKANGLGSLIYRPLTLLIKKTREKAALACLRSQHRHLNDHLLRDIGYTRPEWEQLITGKEVVQQPESAPRQEQQQPAGTVKANTSHTHTRINDSQTSKKASKIFDDNGFCCTA